MLRLSLLLLLAVACVPRAGGSAAVTPDAGPPPEPEPAPVATSSCDPLSQEGCDVAAGYACVWSAEDDQSACAIPTSRLEAQDPCYPDEPSCAPGLTCTALRSDESTSCYQVCDPSSELGCEALRTPGRDFVCMGLEGLRYGVCLVAGSTCDPLLDSCGAREVCALRGGQTTCLSAGEVPLGGDCSINGCAAGGICVQLADRPRAECFAPCDPGSPRCPGDSGICTGLDGLSFGICQPAPEACSPIDDECPSDSVCGIRGVGTACVAPGAVALGGDCEAEACAPGGVCARMVGEAGARCHQPCDLGLPRCSAPTEECHSVGLSFGLCL